MVILSEVFGIPIYFCQKVKMGVDEFGERVALAKQVYATAGRGARQDFIGKDINTSKVLMSGVTENEFPGYEFVRTKNSVYCSPIR